MKFVRKGLICKTITVPSDITSEIISSELTIIEKKWIVYSVYRPPKESNLITFFQDLAFLLNKYLSTYDNVVVMGGFNIDVKEVTNQSLEKLNTFCKTFGWSYLVKGYTCYPKTYRPSIDLLFTNKASSFHLTKATETDITDQTDQTDQTTRLKSKKFLYRYYKLFDEKAFLFELESKT